MTCAVTTSRGADNPHTGHSCQRSARVLGTAAPHTHTWLVPRGSTFTSSRPALAASYQSLAKKEFHPASWTGPANIPRESPLMFKSSTAINPRSEEHTSELQSRRDLVCRLLLEKKKNGRINTSITHAYSIVIDSKHIT